MLGDSVWDQGIVAIKTPEPIWVGHRLVPGCLELPAGVSVAFDLRVRVCPSRVDDRQRDGFLESFQVHGGQRPGCPRAGERDVQVIPSGLDVLGRDALHPVLGLEIEIEDRHTTATRER